MVITCLPVQVVAGSILVGIIFIPRCNRRTSNFLFSCINSCSFYFVHTYQISPFVHFILFTHVKWSWVLLGCLAGLTCLQATCSQFFYSKIIYMSWKMFKTYVHVQPYVMDKDCWESQLSENLNLYL